MAALPMEELLKLDVETRLRIIEQLWDSIVDNEHELPLGADDRAVLDERLAAYRRDPDAGASWAEVRARVFRRG
jgi:putative addiction module component (TIGR02574 family)